MCVPVLCSIRAYMETLAEVREGGQVSCSITLLYFLEIGALTELGATVTASKPK